MITFQRDIKHLDGVIPEYFSTSKFLTALEFVIHTEIDGSELVTLLFQN